MTGALNVTRAGIAVATTDGLVLQNTTAATSGVTSQWSPALHFISQGWKTSSTTQNRQVEWKVESQPRISSNGEPSNFLVFTSIHPGLANKLIWFGTGPVWSANGPVGIWGLDGSGLTTLDDSTGFAGIGACRSVAGSAYALYSNGTQQLTIVNTAVIIASTSQLGFGSGTSPNSAGSIDLSLNRDAADTLAQRRTTNAQTFRLYGTYTDTSNYRRLNMSVTTGGVATLDATGAGTGASGNQLIFGVAGTTQAGFNGTVLAIGPSVAFTTSFPALKRNAAVLECKLADDSGYAQLYGATMRTSQYTVATLPAAATAGAGATAFVTDSLTAFAAALGAAVVGGGANKVTVFSDGTNWIVG
jgi:hypothetical protein